MVSTSTLPTTTEPEFGYGQLFQILLRRWPWIAGALSLGLATAVYINLQEQPEYQSDMQLIVEPNFRTDWRATDFNESEREPIASEGDFATQLALMRSDQFLVEASQRLQSTYPDLTLDAIKAGFTLNRLAEDKTSTRIFQATFVSDSPLKTQRLLETLQAIYTEYNLQQQQTRLERGLEHIDEQLVTTQENLRDSQSALEQFRRSADLIDPTLQGQVVLDGLNQLQVEKQQLFKDLAEVETRYAALEGQLQLSPQAGLAASRLSGSDRVQGLVNTVQQTSLALAERRILFTDQDPAVQVLAAQQQNELDALRREVASILRQPVGDLTPELESYLQLGDLDRSLVAQLVELDATLSALEARADSLTALEQELQRDLEQFPGLIAEYDRLQPGIETDRATLERLLAQREQLTSELARGGFTWEVVQTPREGLPLPSSATRNLMLGAVAGLFLGGLLAFARESTDNVLRTSDDLKRQVPLPLLGILPQQTAGGRFSFGASRREGALPPMLHPELAESALIQTVSSPAFREAMDVMTNSLQLRSPGPGSKTFAITSGLPGEGKTTVALGLALSLTRMNQRVLLIDADLRRSGLQAELGIDSEQGLSTFLKGLPVGTRPHRLDLGYAHLDVLPAGPVPDDPIPLLSSPRFSKLIAKSREVYDVILIDTPPVLGMADAVKVGSVCDGTVVVTRLDRITQKELTEMLSLLAPLKVLGMIANGAKDTPTRYGSYAAQAYAPKLVKV